MTWTYDQSSGALSHDGKFIAFGYSGIDAGYNNPAMASSHNTGPIPKGKYTIGKPFHHPKTGGNTMRLTPSADTETYGRAGFMIHGDSKAHPGKASHGCIILLLIYRTQIMNSDDKQLEVK
ncbi:tlde1 domain-containing protein [Acetobacter thailandicus]|uniref:tlde1 domain-containing protein n=1 Tax=Acetobacter thailandicus TaxID=1502842 RepID=UPI001BA77D0B|nr:tlde1 domain-containing protein [Acetobacter thailandicus]MBS1002925.1 DUF2778 domain-containing protein [Acetobacter thailandicus]